jgi:hypothetical protein
MLRERTGRVEAVDQLARELEGSPTQRKSAAGLATVNIPAGQTKPRQ